MSLHSFERALLTIYTDSHTLQTYLKDREMFYKEYDLTKIEREGLETIPHERLIAFQNQLHQKSLGIAKKILTGRKMVSLLTLNTGGPVLLTGPSTHPFRTPLTRGEYQMLHRLARTKEPLTIFALAREYVQTPLCTPRDLFSLSRLVINSKIRGYTVRIPFFL